MPMYYYVLPGRTFHRQISPALAASWQQRSFAPCRDLCASLAESLASPGGDYLQSAKPLLCQAAQGLSFDRLYWTHLVGEILVYSAVRMPEIPVSPETLCCLLAPACNGEDRRGREQWAPVEQACYGSQDLLFGGKHFRPEKVGWNDHSDIVRLADYLAAVEPARWDVADLRPLADAAGDEELGEELEFAREWFPALCELYQSAHAEEHIIVCESL
jgi:hypothetical protein